MTDSWLMEADCIHGNTWYECPECDALYADPDFDADSRRVVAQQEHDDDGDDGGEHDNRPPRR